MKLNIANLVHESLVEGHGIREVLAVQGCPHFCKGCHSPHTWKFGAGTEVGVEEMAEFLLAYSHCDGVTFSGGEPFSQARALASLAELLKQERPSWDIWVYSGWYYRQLQSKALTDWDVARLLDLTDVLVDGPFVEEFRDLSLPFRGSSNQRVIELKKASSPPSHFHLDRHANHIIHRRWEKQTD